MTGTFEPTYSTNNIWWDEEFDQCLTLHLEEMKSDIATLETGKANTSHTHSGYVSQSDLASGLEVLEDAIATKASVNHTHTDYATTTSLSELSTVVSGKANISHSHNDIYYTEAEIDTLLASKAASSHTHTGVYDASGAATSALASANAYTDSKIDALVGEGASTTLDTIGEISSAIEDNQDAIDLLNAAIGNKANVTHTHAVTDITNLQTALDAKAASEHTHIISNIDSLQTALNAKADSSHSHNDVYYTETEVDTLLSAKANTSHTHTIANITGLQSALDGKAATSHGTHVSYSTTTPVMDGSASVGTATTVARSDHKHPTDTSRASQVDLDALETVVAGKATTSSLTSHTSNKSNPHGITLAQLGLTTTAAELNYVDGVTSNIQTQLNGKAASSHNHDSAYAGISHNHSGVYATASHSHTASAVGAVATSDIATVSEVETYLGI